MKIYITKTNDIKTKLIAENLKEAQKILIESDSNYFIINGKLVYEFDDGKTYDVYFKELEIKPGIIT